MPACCCLQCAAEAMPGSTSVCLSDLPALQISITFKNQQVLKDCSWEVKKGERVGLVGGWKVSSGSLAG